MANRREENYPSSSYSPIGKDLGLVPDPKTLAELDPRLQAKETSDKISFGKNNFNAMPTLGKAVTLDLRGELGGTIVAARDLEDSVSKKAKMQEDRQDQRTESVIEKDMRLEMRQDKKKTIKDELDQDKREQTQASNEKKAAIKAGEKAKQQSSSISNPGSTPTLTRGRR